jgi:excisionase family DNA binding protein
MSTSIDNFVSVAEAAEIIGVSQDSVYVYVRNGRLKHHRPFGPKGAILIDRRDAERFKRRPVGNPSFQKKRRPAKKLAT